MTGVLVLLAYLAGVVVLTALADLVERTPWATRDFTGVLPDDDTEDAL